MFSCKVNCPNCSHTFSHQILKLKSRYVCESCGHTIMVEPKMMVTFLVGVTLFFFAETFLHVLEVNGISTWLRFTILIITIYFCYFLLLFLLAKFCGTKRIYHITDFKEK